MEEALFYTFSVVAVAGAVGVLLNVRNTINAALSLVVTMLALAALFIMLNAEFIGVLQVMVYAGAIVVLFLFVVMLLNLRGGSMGAESQPFLKTVGALIVAAASVKLALLLDLAPRAWPAISEDYGSVAEMGRILYTDYLLAVQAAGVLLLAGIVGAVIMAKRSID